ncbi:MAG: DUF6516 family protein [Desulfobacterales bacterium]
MNPVIVEYFRNIEKQLLENQLVISYKILRREVAYTDGKLRIKVTFADRSMAELFEYITISDGRMNLSKYGFHWQDKQGELKCRWDNAPHHPELPNAPHHRHNSDGSVSGIMQRPLWCSGRNTADIDF